MNNTATPSATKFQVGNTYSARSASDHNCVWTFTVIARTAKFVTITDGDETRRVGAIVSSFDGAEYALPFGSYSMAPVIRASR